MDGIYNLTSLKMRISAGELDQAETIMHRVQAGLVDAPRGSKGIDLSTMFKFQVIADGTLGERNATSCTSIEHKMGINGDATFHMFLDGAVNSLVDQPQTGLNEMFVAMNAARLSVGLTEMAYQDAMVYAKDCIQIRSLYCPKASEKAADPIIVRFRDALAQGGWPCVSRSAAACASRPITRA